jgi:hypothetical protein
MRWAKPLLMLSALWVFLAPRPVAAAAAAPAKAVERVIADFESGLPPGLVAQAGDVTTGDSGNARRGQALRVTLDAGDGRKPSVELPVGEDEARQLSQRGEFAFAYRVTSNRPEVDLRWVALDDAGRTLFQKRLAVPAGRPWQDAGTPLHEWRWGNDSVGAWSEVRRLVLAVESPAAELWLDDVRPAGARRDERQGAEWLRRIAFGGADARVAEADGLMVATDATDGMTEQDVMRLLAQTRKVRALVARLFGNAVRPVDDGTPPALLIFKTPAGELDFWKRLGEAWKAQIAPPTAGGYTVADVATSTFDPKLGPARPVYLHESVHAVVAHDLRLLTGGVNHSWLHEGLASYVQLCVFPNSLDRETYPRNFARADLNDGRGLFRPLRQLLTRRVSTREHAQLASLVAYLVEQKPAWLPTIARSLADGDSAERALGRCGTSFAELEKAWLAWGAEHFPAAGERPDHHFETPPEWQADPKVDERQDAKPRRIELE